MDKLVIAMYRLRPIQLHKLWLVEHWVHFIVRGARRDGLFLQLVTREHIVAMSTYPTIYIIHTVTYHKVWNMKFQFGT